MFTGCSDKDNADKSKEKPILYKYSIEDYDYNKESFKGYSIEYTAVVSGFKTDFSIRLQFNEDNTCTYNATYKNETGTTTLLVDSTCNYTIDKNVISLKIDSLKQIYEPSYMAKQQGFKSNTSYETNLSIEGELSETGKNLKIGNLSYHHISYLVYMENRFGELLLDPKTNMVYDVYGRPASNKDPEYVLNNSLDLSEYKIIDKTNRGDDNEANNSKEDPVKESTVEYDKEFSGCINAKHILISPDVTSLMTNEEKTKEEEVALLKAKEIISRLEQGENFDYLAKNYSKDESTAKNNGDLGCFSHKQFPAEFENAVLKLKRGEYTKEPVKTSFGYHIILRG